MMVWLREQEAGDDSLDCSSHLLFCRDLFIRRKGHARL